MRKYIVFPEWNDSIHLHARPLDDFVYGKVIRKYTIAIHNT